MDKFLREYNGHVFEDYHTSCSDDFKSFAKKFKNYLKRNLPDCEITGHGCNHYDLSGFLKKDGMYIYYSYSWDRFSPVDVNEDCNCMQSVLVRYAANEKDYHGEFNQFTSLTKIPEKINEMFERRMTI